MNSVAKNKEVKSDFYVKDQRWWRQENILFLDNYLNNVLNFL